MDRYRMFMFAYEILPSADGPTLEISPLVGVSASTSGVKEYGRLLSELCPRKVVIRGNSPAYVPNPDFVNGKSGIKKRFGPDIRDTLVSMYCSQQVFSDVTTCAIFDVSWSNLSSTSCFMEAITAKALWPFTKEPDANLNLAHSISALKEAAKTLHRSYAADFTNSVREDDDVEEQEDEDENDVEHLRKPKGEDCLADREFYTLIKRYALKGMEMTGVYPPTPRSVLCTLDNSLCLAESLMRKQGLLPDTEYPPPSAGGAEYSSTDPPTFATNDPLYKLRQIGKYLAYKPDYLMSSEIHTDLRNVRVEIQKDEGLRRFNRTALAEQYSKRLDNVLEERIRWERMSVENINNPAFGKSTTHVFAAFKASATAYYVKEIELKDITCFQTPFCIEEILQAGSVTARSRLRQLVVNNCTISMDCLSNLASYARLSVNVFELVDIPPCLIDGSFESELSECGKMMCAKNINLRHTHSPAQETLMLLDELPMSVASELMSMDRLGKAKEVYVRFVAQFVVAINYIQIRVANAATVELLNSTLHLARNEAIQMPCLRQYEQLHCNLLHVEQFAATSRKQVTQNTFGFTLQEEVARQKNVAVRTEATSSLVHMLPAVLQRVGGLYDTVASALPPVMMPVPMEPNVYWGRYNITRPNLGHKCLESCRRVYCVEVAFTDEHSLMLNYGAASVGTSPITGQKFVTIEVRVYTSNLTLLLTLQELLGAQGAQHVLNGEADLEVMHLKVSVPQLLAQSSSLTHLTALKLQLRIFETMSSACSAGSSSSSSMLAPNVSSSPSGIMY